MTRVNLARYRLDKAKEFIIEAEDAFKQSHFGLSVNRSYYAMFTSARSLLALKELDSSKHSGVISLFNQHIVKNDLFSKELARFLPKARDIRESADYGDFVRITDDDAIKQIDNAKRFVEEAERVLIEMM